MRDLGGDNRSATGHRKQRWSKRVLKSAILNATAAAAILCSVHGLAQAATMETVVQGVVANSAGPDHVDQDGLDLFPNLTGTTGNFTGIGKAFTFTFTWDSTLAEQYDYDYAPGNPLVGGIEVEGVSTDERAPNRIIKSSALTVNGQTVNFSTPNFFTINQYDGDRSQEYLMRFGGAFDAGSTIYFKGAGINPLPSSIFGTFTDRTITKGFPSYGYVSLLNNGLKTEFGFDISSISVSVLDAVAPVITPGIGTGGGTGIDIDKGGTGNAADVPLPAAFVLLLSALGGITVLGRWRAKTAAA
jgi:hypothetical protein